MPEYAFAPPERPSLAIAGSSGRFPIRRVFCVGRNYADHAREFGNDPDREPPFFFMKPADAVTQSPEVPYPPLTSDLHFEAELVVAIGKGGFGISPERALDHVFGYAAGNDLTRRDLQSEAKSMRRPWDLAKGFDMSAVCGLLHSASETGHLDSGEIVCRVNGEARQRGDLSDMIWPVPDILSFLSRSVEMAPGDLVFTGTPSGVGTLDRGDSCEVRIRDFLDLAFRIV